MRPKEDTIDSEQLREALFADFLAQAQRKRKESEERPKSRPYTNPNPFTPDSESDVLIAVKNDEGIWEVK